MIDLEKLNLTAREAAHFQAPEVIGPEDAVKAWVAARLFCAWLDVMTDGPDESDKQMAQRWFEAGHTLSRDLKPEPSTQSSVNRGEART